MLKKRILASSMASVMALTSISAVAFADETATYGNKTRKDLSDYVNGDVVKKLNEKIGEYNTNVAEKFNNAYNHAKNVMDNRDATSNDVTAAYRMLTAVVAETRHYTLDELKTLKADVDSTLGSNNDLKGGFDGDTRFDNDAWNTAKNDSEIAGEVIGRGATATSSEIDDAYVNLNNSKSVLADKKLAQVTKSEFVREYQKLYDTLAAKRLNFDAWARFKIEGTGVKGYDGLTVAYGTLVGHMDALLAECKTKSDDFVGNNATVTTREIYKKALDAMKDANKIMTSVTSKNPVNGYKTSASVYDVQRLIAPNTGKYHNILAFTYGSSDVSALLTSAIDAAADAVTGGVTGAKVEITTGKKAATAAKASVADYVSTSAAATSCWSELPAANTFKTPSFKIKFSVSDKFFAKVRLSDGSYCGFEYSSDGKESSIATQLSEDEKKVYKYTKVSGEIDLAKVVDLSHTLDTASEAAVLANKVVDGDQATDVDGSTEIDFGFADGNYDNNLIVRATGLAVADSMKGKGTTEKDKEGDTIAADGNVSLATGLPIAIKHLLNNNSTAVTVDAGNAVATPAKGTLTIAVDTDGDWLTMEASSDNYTKLKADGSRASISNVEYTNIYNYLNYALRDVFVEPAGNTYGREDVNKKVNEFTELLNKTENISLAATQYNAANEAVKQAKDWYTAAYKDKGYKKETALPYAGTDRVADFVMDDLNNKYNDLNDMAKKFKYTFGEIADKISSASDLYDANKSADLKKAIDECAYALSTVVAIEGSPEAFSDNQLNRASYLNSEGSDSQKDLNKKYEALLALTDNLKGDVNGDGKITAADATLILKHVAAIGATNSPDTLTGEKLAKADCDGKAGVTSADAAWVLKKVAESV